MKVYKVGGAVRDELLGLNPQDHDYVVVGATSQEMVALGYKQVGADFPVFLHPETNEEYALARVERKTGEGYGGFSTETNGVTLEEDLSRRDLTINAMAMAEDGTVVDPFNGREDLKNKQLRHVSDAFMEDPLRVVRLARFYARYKDFNVAPETLDLARDLIIHGDLNTLSKERFWTEMQKAFNDDRPDRFFKFLVNMECFRHVTFFNDIFGDVDQDQLELMERTCFAVHHQSPDDRMLFFVALMAKPDAMWSVAATKLMTLHKNVQVLRTMESTPDGVFKLLKQAKAWGVGEQVSDLLTAMAIGNLLGEEYPVNLTVLMIAFEETSKVKSDMFPNVQGKMLGEAIDFSRKRVILSCLNQYKDA